MDMLNPSLNKIGKAKNYAEVKKILTNAFEGSDDSELIEVLEQLSEVSEAIGYAKHSEEK
jgi:hypothetical protein